MALLTQQQWYEKLRSFVPLWYFETEENQVAHMQAVAAVLEASDDDIIDHCDQTFITKATGEFLDEHGFERSLSRIGLELDPQFRNRIRNLGNKSNCPDLQALIDLFLMVGTATITEDYNSAIFANRESFVNRGTVVIDPIEQAFSVLVDKQIHAPYSFVDREYFSDREDYVGTNESSQYVFDLIVQVVNQNKACGVLYRVIERTT